jgi:hypothetical protein
MATLALRIGGSSFLSICNKAGMLPSRSIVSMALKNNIYIESSFQKNLSETIMSNMKQFFQQRHCSYFTIKLDELAITPRVRWNSKNNELVGTCFNHKYHQTSYEFKNELVLHQIKNHLKCDRIHLAKECLIVTLSAISNNQSDKNPKVICNLPICSHKNSETLKTVIKEIRNNFHSLNPDSKIVNVATDGDPYRRNVLNEMREENQFLDELKLLKHFDQQFLLGKYGINYDPKHIVKRIRSYLIGKKSFQLIKVPITRDVLKFFLIKKSKETQEHINHLMDPKDKQNVPYAVKLLNLMHQFSSNFDSIESPVEKDQLNEIQLISILCQLFLSIFTNTSIDLSTQLINLSQLSHSLFVIYRRSKLNGFRFMRKDLYMDIQSTVQDAFISAATFRIDRSENPLFIYQLGTDQLENLFSSIRTITHSQTCDSLELNDRLKMSYDIEDVYSRRPELRPTNKLTNKSKSTYTLDHSSIYSWSGDHSTINLDLFTIWSLGYEKSMLLLKNYGYDDDEFIIGEEYTMMNPIGCDDDDDDDEEVESDEINIVDLESADNNAISTSIIIETAYTSDNENDEEIQTEPVTIEEEDDSENFMELVDHANMSSTTSSKVMLDGVEMHKSRAVNLVINCAPYRQDRDRINRVKNSQTSQKYEINKNDICDAEIRITDLMVTVAKFKDSTIAAVVFSIDKIVKGNMSMSSIDSIDLNQAVLSGPIINLNYIEGDSYVFHDGSYGDIISAKGNFCVKIEGRVEDVDSNSLLVFDGKDIKNHIDFCNSLLDTNREMTVKMKKITSAFSNKETFEYFKLKEFIANTNSTTTCQTCFNEVQISKLRQHNAKHMLLKEIKNQANTCGICGLNNCTVSIKVTSGCGQKANRGIECNCKYYLKISLKSLEKSTTNKPCTNRPVQCQINGCNTVLWSYNIESHYHVNHPGETIPQMITQIEIDRILSGSV